MAIRLAVAAGLGLGVVVAPGGDPALAQAALEDRIVPVQLRCVPQLSCWRNHWGFRQCVRRWICDEGPPPGWRGRRGPAPRFSPDDYPPGAGAPRRGRRHTRRDDWDDPRDGRWEDDSWRLREGPAVLRPRPLAPPPEPRPRRQVTVLPRLKTVPGAPADRDARPEREPGTGREMDRETGRTDRTTPEPAVRRDEPRQTAPGRQAEPPPSREVEVVPRRPDSRSEDEPPDAPKSPSARLKEPPATPDKREPERKPAITITPLPDATPAPEGDPKPRPEADRTPAPDPAPEAKPGPADRPGEADQKADDPKTEVPDDIDKLPRGRKIPPEELDPERKPEKPKRERIPI